MAEGEERNRDTYLGQSLERWNGKVGSKRLWEVTTQVNNTCHVYVLAKQVHTFSPYIYQTSSIMYSKNAFHSVSQAASATFFSSASMLENCRS
jgi:hypothetical protein